VTWWPVKYLGFGSLIWLPVAAAALLTEVLLRRRLSPYIHPATAVAAAAFMIAPTVATDVITSYDSTTPALAGAIAMVVMQFQQFVRLPSAIRALERVLEPFVVVLAGWSDAYFFGRGDVGVSDLRWQLPLLALLCSMAAGFAAQSSYAGKGRT
jgi:hypothetical protein